MKSAYKIATRIAMMYQGRIIQTGEPAAIRDSGDPIVQQFITGSAKGPMTDISFKSLEQIEGER
jgi:phospholipid/cholesterol/gamma-HCH transport system ATP-binding protein